MLNSLQKILSQGIKKADVFWQYIFIDLPLSSLVRFGRIGKFLLVRITDPMPIALSRFAVLQQRYRSIGLSLSEKEAQLEEKQEVELSVPWAFIENFKESSQIVDIVSHEGEEFILIKDMKNHLYVMGSQRLGGVSSYTVKAHRITRAKANTMGVELVAKRQTMNPYFNNMEYSILAKLKRLKGLAVLYSNVICFQECLPNLLDEPSMAPIDLYEASQMALQLLKQLQALHDLGYTHNDLLDNILVSYQQRAANIIDFGLSFAFPMQLAGYARSYDLAILEKFISQFLLMRVIDEPERQLQARKWARELDTQAPIVKTYLGTQTYSIGELSTLFASVQPASSRVRLPTLQSSNKIALSKLFTVLMLGGLLEMSSIILAGNSNKFPKNNEPIFTILFMLSILGGILLSLSQNLDTVRHRNVHH